MYQGDQRNWGSKEKNAGYPGLTLQDIFKNNYSGEIEQLIAKIQRNIDILAENKDINITLMKKTKAEICKKIKEVEDSYAVKDGQAKQPVAKAIVEIPDELE